MTNIDKENIIKSMQTANLLIQDLNELLKSNSPSLVGQVDHILEQSLSIENDLKNLYEVSEKII